jgi:hypothetical protein
VNENFVSTSPVQLNEAAEVAAPPTGNIENQNRLHDLLNPSTLIMPVNFYKFENMITLSSLTRRLEENQSRNLLNGLACSHSETSNDTFISDLVRDGILL